jgi:hypothetical protein
MHAGVLAVVGFGQVVDLMRAVVWPVAVMVAVIVLRDPLTRLLGRATRVSAFSVSIDLATATEFKAPAWGVGAVPDVRKPSPAPPMTSAPEALFIQLSDPAHVDYAVIDLGTGTEWLTSRVYLFSMLLQRYRGLRCLVFVETVGDLRRQFIVSADPTDVTTALANRYPRLDRAFAAAYAGLQPDPPQPDSNWNAFRTSTLVNQYLTQLQAPAPEGDPADWVEINAPGVWEYSKWFTGARLERLLADRGNASAIPYRPDEPQRTQLASVVRRSGPFVAIVEDGRFRDLIDRESLLEQTAIQAVEAAQGDEP